MKSIIALMLLLSFSLLQSCSTARPVNATGNTISSSMGKACATDILGIIPLETDASIFRAAKNGGIRKVATVDFEGFMSGFYNKYCTVVHGSK